MFPSDLLVSSLPLSSSHQIISHLSRISFTSHFMHVMYLFTSLFSLLPFWFSLYSLLRVQSEIWDDVALKMRLTLFGASSSKMRHMVSSKTGRNRR